VTGEVRFGAPFRTLLLVAAATTLLGVGFWLFTPSITSSARDSGRASPSTEIKQAIVQSKPTRSSIADVTDLGALQRLADDGDPAAQFAIGAHYATGEEVEQNYSEAVRWFSSAAEQGHVVAQATLGAYYWAGRGVAQDLGKAYYWSILAQAGGDEASKYRVAVLASRMTRSQVIAAQQEANDWIKQHQLASNQASPGR
jgi:TPR repeat protein